MAINMSKHKMTLARCQSSHYYVSTSPTLIYGPGWAAGIFWRDQSTSLLPPSPLPPPLLLTSSSKFIPCPTSSHQTTHSPPAQPGRPAAANVYILPTTVYIRTVRSYYLAVLLNWIKLASLCVIEAVQQSLYTRFLPTPARKESNVPNLKTS